MGNIKEEINIVYDLEIPVRIDKYLSESLENFTRSQIQLMVGEELVLVNGNPIKANYRLKNNDNIKILVKAAIPSSIEPENIPLNVVYEDSDIIVVNKPSGMVVHPANGNYEHTLVNALLYHCKDLSGINGELRAGIVHRIDKDTSGLIVACKNDLAHKNLSEQFANHEVNKIYYALCHGVIPHNAGMIDAPIGRNPDSRQERAVVEGGKNSITHFKVLERFDKYTLIEVKLETGRTHQIRVHMKYIGYPLVGDPVYGPKKIEGHKGQFLHAKKLEFHHPRTQKFMSFECDLPDYFQDFLKQIK